MTDEPIKKMFHCGDANEFFVVCPYCGFDYVHVKELKHSPGGDYESSGVHDIGVRGAVYTLSFWGECGHEWVVVLGEHKGNVTGKVVQTQAPQ